MFNSILVVCTGNICRSPIAERLLRRALPHKKIDSAGTKALISCPADPSSLAVSQKHGLSLDNHTGRKFTATLGRQYDLILVMEREHIEQIGSMAPEVRGKTMLLGHWLNNRDIPDPYHKSEEAFESVYQLIEQACQCWVDKLGN